MLLGGAVKILFLNAATSNNMREYVFFIVRNGVCHTYLLLKTALLSGMVFHLIIS